MQQSQLFAIFFYACILTINLSGPLADFYNPKMLVFATILCFSVAELLSPLLADWSYYTFLASRASMGMAEGERRRRKKCLGYFLRVYLKGFIWPCLTAVVVRWIPPDERATAAAIYR